MSDNDTKGVAALIPAYNEARTIRGLALQALANVGRVYIVDDGSSDGTGDCVRDLPVVLLSHPRNRGKGAALKLGFAAAREAGCTAVVTLDGDGQHLPGNIPDLLAAYRRSPGTLVLGARQHKRRDAPTYRRMANGVADFFISWAAGKHIVDTQSGFRVYPPALMDTILNGDANGDTGFAFEAEVLITAGVMGVPMVLVEVPTVYSRNFRRSHYRPVADTCRITCRVASMLVRRRLNTGGLARA